MMPALRHERPIVAYVFLAAAIFFEIIATSLIKSTAGFTRLWPTLGCLCLYGVAFFLLAQAISRGMQVGVSYALWSALGTTIVVAVGVVFFGEPLSTLKIFGVALVVLGVVALNLAGTH